MGKLCYKQVSRPSCVAKGLRGTSRHRTRRQTKIALQDDFAAETMLHEEFAAEPASQYDFAEFWH